MGIAPLRLIASLAAAALLPLASAPLHARADQAEPAPVPDEIEVRGKLEIDKAIVAQNLREMTTRPRVFDSVPRFFEPLCLHVVGPDQAANRMIARRIMDAAAEAGLEKPEPRCQENAFVIIVDEPKQLVERLVARRHSVTLEFGRDVTWRKLHDELSSGKPAVVWNRFTFTFAGVPAPLLPGDIPVLRSPTGTRLPGGAQRPKALSVVLFDADLIGGATPAQLGDYAALQLLAAPRRNIDFEAVSARSILALFADGPDLAPEGLTAFDRAYLRGVYNNKGNGLRGHVNRATLAAYQEECAEEAPDCQYLVPATESEGAKGKSTG